MRSMLFSSVSNSGVRLTRLVQQVTLPQQSQIFALFQSSFLAKVTKWKLIAGYYVVMKRIFDALSISCVVAFVSVASGAVAADKTLLDTAVGTSGLIDAGNKGGIFIRELRVLSYNINGLPPPVKKGRGPHFERIAELLKERRANGTQPHVVLIQEAFDGRTKIVAEKTGYKYVLYGPGRKDTSKLGRVHWAQQTRKPYMSFSDPQKFTGSGLMILSDFPIIEAFHKTFNSDECAGIDCLSNKSILFARIQVPGVSEPVDIINSHFNSRSAAKAPKKISLRIHKRQADVLKWFIEKTSVGNPLILAGDFNTKQPARYEYFSKLMGLRDAGEKCVADTVTCTISVDTKIDMVLYNTNDKHFFENGSRVQVSPRFIERNFDEVINGKPLSDHLGYEV
ncbi:MAG: endonuclease/exonuclease/phosphatase family protein, partial [Kordiimonadaceae bacterium]|nr:endonuclease/exonuclease/phosphatase family protein [Kordiimonadaceae bacterium]